MDWRIYYADGTTFDSSQGEWANAPADGVIAVNVRYPALGSRTLSGVDHYYALPQSLDIFQADDLGPYLRRYVPNVKFGVATYDSDHKAIVRRACKDPDFPRANPQRRHDDGGKR